MIHRIRRILHTLIAKIRASFSSIDSVPLEELLSDSDLNSIRDHFGSKTWIAALQDLHIKVERSNHVYKATISNVPECLEKLVDLAYSLKYQKFPSVKKEIVQFILHFYGRDSIPSQYEVTIHEEIYTVATGIEPLKSLALALVPTISIAIDIRKLLILQLVGGCSRVYNEGEQIRGDINILLRGQGLDNLLREIASSKDAYMTGQDSSDTDLIEALNGEGGFVCIHEILEMGDSQLVLMHEAMEDVCILCYVLSLSYTKYYIKLTLFLYLSFSKLLRRC